MTWVLKINLDWWSLIASTSTHWAILLAHDLQILLPLCLPHWTTVYIINPVTSLARSLCWFSIYSKKNAKTSQTPWACLWPDHISSLTTLDHRLYFQCFSFCSACPRLYGHDILPEWVPSVQGPCTHPCCMLYFALSATLPHSDLLEAFPQLPFSYQVFPCPLGFKLQITVNLPMLSLFPKHLLTFSTYV